MGKREQKYLGLPQVNHYTRDNSDDELIYKGYVFSEPKVNKAMIDSYTAASQRKKETSTQSGFASWAKRNAMYAVHILETFIISGAYIEFF